MTAFLRRIRPDLPWLGLILLPYIVLIALVPPTGEFPTTDDFDYAATAWHLADHGQLTLSDWPAMTLIAHAAWGALACKLFGNSFAVLRTSVCLLSLLAAVAIYAGFRDRDHSRSLCSLAAVCFAVSPLTVALEYTFMTDITGAAFAAILIAAAPQIRSTPASRLVGYSLLGAIAYLARETAAIPWMIVVFTTGWSCLRRVESWRSLFWLAGPASLLIALYQYWLREFHGVPFNRSQPALDPAALLADPQRPLFLATGLALALAPLTVSLIRSRRPRWWLLPLAAGLTGVALVCAGVQVTPPYRDELFDLGLRLPESPLGRIPASLRGPAVSLAGRDISLVRVLATGVAWFSAAALAAVLTARWSRSDDVKNPPAPQIPVATWTCLSMIGLYCLTRGFADRYLLSLIPPALLMLAERMPPHASPPARRLGWIAAAGIAVVSLVGIQDAMQRSRAFWTAAARLQQQGVDPFTVDAGIAFGGLSRFNPVYRGEANRGPFWNLVPANERSNTIAPISPLTTTLNRIYRISFDKREYGYHPIDSVPFESWLRTGEVRIFLRNDQSANRH